MTPGLLAALFLAAPVRAAVAPPDAPCVSFGDHTERIPDFDPMTRACTTAVLSDPAAFDAAWAKLIAKVRTGGGRLMPVDGEVEQALGRGNVRAETLDDAGHWGDIAYVQMKGPGDGLVPVAVFAVTYRAQRVRDAIMATRVDFQTDGQGRLHAVHIWHGIRLPGAPGMAWSQGPVTTINQDTMLEGLWQLRFHQLVLSWAE